MCGFLGFSGATQRSSLHAGARAIAHRGPDSFGVFEDEKYKIGLAHVRLSIIDVSPLGHQPMASPGNRVVIAFNGEIFNFLDLRAELEGKGHRFRGHSDTEVLLHLYIAEGVEMLRRLNGMFAFAIWDSVRRAILVARDEMGVKPLYFAEAEGAVVFGSEIKALLPFPGVGGGLDPVAFRDHLTYLWAPAPRTLFKGVHKLPPGHAMWLKDGRVERQWSWAGNSMIGEPRQLSDEESISAVRGAVGLAVKRQLISDVPVGAFLSGGLDSSAVVAMAVEADRSRALKCFTLSGDPSMERSEGIASDLPYAREVAERFSLPLEEVSGVAPTADDLLQMVWHLDEPQADLAPLGVLAIARRARQQGVKVLLSGAGGDDIFTGYRRHLLLLAAEKTDAVPMWIRLALSRLMNRLPVRHPTVRRVRKALSVIGQTGDARVAGLFEWLDRGWVDQLLSPEFRAASRRPDPLLESLKGLSSDVPDLNRMLFLECRHFLADHNLNYTDKMSMAVGVEVRVPLLDRDLVRLAFELPLRVKHRGSRGKWVLHEAMRGIVPDNILDRPKTGFGMPLRELLRGPLRELLRDTLSSASVRARGVYDAASVNRLLIADESGAVDGAYPLFAVLLSELWCRSFLDAQGPIAHAQVSIGSSRGLVR